MGDVMLKNAVRKEANRCCIYANMAEPRPENIVCNRIR